MKGIECKKSIHNALDENPLRCTTHDEKGLVYITILFYPIF
jgi:hypothetical protein